MIDKTTLKLVIYKRVSTKDQEISGLGLLAQERDIQNKILSLKTEYSKILILKEFTEVASGKNIKNRFLLSKAIKLVARDPKTFLLVQKIDRLSRNIKDGIDIFEKLNKRILFCDIKTNNMMVISIFLAHAQEEREAISLRVKKALSELKSKGKKLGRPYKKYSNGKIIKGQNKEAVNYMNIIRLKQSQKYYKEIKEFAIKMKNKNFSLNSIAKMLNNLGKRTIRNKQFNHSTILQIIKKKEI